MTDVLVHNSNIVVGEHVAISFLLIVLFGMFMYREHRKSSMFLAITIVIETICLMADSMAFSYDIDGDSPLWLMKIAFFISYTFGSLVLITFSLYVRTFICEKTQIGKWICYVPIILSLVSFGSICVAIFTGHIFIPIDGVLTTVGEPPVISQIIQFVLIAFFPIAAFTKRREIGIKSVLLLGLFGLIPGVMIFISFDYSMMCVAFALVIIYVLLQCDTSAEKEKRQKELEEMNAKLNEANEEIVAQLEEIKALNKQLEENQSHAIRSLLDNVINQNEDELLIDDMVQGVGEYFDADRAYIFERDVTGQYTVNTYEWCAEGVAPEKDNLQEVPINVVDPWMDEFRKKGSFYISCDDEYARKEPMVYEVLEPQGITSLMAAPMVINGDIIGFLGVDNPKENLEHELYLSVAATTINHERQIIVEKELEAVYKQELEKSKTEAEAANEAKSSFLFNMSHDIRTPMNAIIGFRDLLEKHQEDPEKRADYLGKIEAASDVLLSIINNVLEMARIEKGVIEIDEAAWSADQFIDTLYSIFQEMMDQKGIEFTRQYTVEHEYIYCDPIKLRELFINILSNAYKYTNAGGSVSISLTEIPSDREGYVLYQTTITDTGIGMSEEFLPHIFEEFSRESNTTDNKIEGTGLGMPIVKRLVELMDGSIEVKSKKGEGSSFVVTIPHKIADKSVFVDYAGLEVDTNIFAGKRVLLTEDNEFNAEIAIEILEEAGFVVDHVEDGTICCEKLNSAAEDYYDIILMDIQMPKMNGYEAAKTIRNMSDTAKAKIPIIAMTANAFEEDKREALRAGMNGHIAKPVKVNEMMKVLAGMLENNTREND